MASLLFVVARPKVKAPEALTAECVADVRTDGTEATIIVSAATNFVNYHDVSGNAKSRDEI